MKQSPDISLENLKSIKEVNQSYFSTDFLSETDTRVKIIDAICKNVLLWPEPEIKREEHVDSGYIDYILSVTGRKYLVVEAKKTGIYFQIPKTSQKRLKLNGTLVSDKNIKAAIHQVRNYCDDAGIKYAITTNGNSWIIFKAIRQDNPWKEGDTRIFSSIDDIIQNFTEFWNLLSYDQISKGSLELEFSSQLREKRSLNRVVDQLFNADVPLLRNSLHAQLSPIIENIFEDIAKEDRLDTLQSCYVYSETLKIVTEDINYVIEDNIPKYLEQEGTEQIISGKSNAGKFGIAVKTSLTKSTGQLFLLLGGIGSGKSTFLRRYQLTVGKNILKKSLWFSVDFLKSPIDPTEMEPFVWSNLLKQLRENYKEINLETRNNIKLAYKTEISALELTILNGLQKDSLEYEMQLSPYLQKWQENISEYVPKLLLLARPLKGFNIVLFIDNVDQLSPTYQAQIFLLAQRVTDKMGSSTVVALREESYYTASIQKVFNAYTNKKFHIASPPFRRMIGQRIRYVVNLMEQNSDPSTLFGTSISIDKTKITNFLKIVEYSVFEKNKHIAIFIETICFGNMRMALQMFSTFLTSGATDVDKMLKIYNRDGNYYVAFHEFLKSIMLNDRYYYKESQSYIMNVFNCGTENNSSHFTSIRLLRFLNLHRSESTPEGKGFVDLSTILNTFEEIFNDREDLVNSLNRLLGKFLIETNTRDTESISKSKQIRLTSAGWYYLKYLIKSFCYLDLVMQDTPFADDDISKKIERSMIAVNNLSDKEEEKEKRMEERFRRVEIFLDYLENEEKHEVSYFNLTLYDGEVFKPIISEIRNSYIEQKEWITNRIKQNRERFAEELIDHSDEDDFLLIREIQ